MKVFKPLIILSLFGFALTAHAERCESTIDAVAASIETSLREAASLDRGAMKYMRVSKDFVGSYDQGMLAVLEYKITLQYQVGMNVNHDEYKVILWNESMYRKCSIHSVSFEN